jgi:hypothetical protein
MIEAVSLLSLSLVGRFLTLKNKDGKENSVFPLVMCLILKQQKVRKHK